MGPRVFRVEGCPSRDRCSRQPAGAVPGGGFVDCGLCGRALCISGIPLRAAMRIDMRSVALPRLMDDEVTAEVRKSKNQEGKSKK